MAVPAALKQQPDTTPLLAYQQAAIDKLAARGGSGGLFMDMGTGKTRAALELAWRLGARRLLVVVPLSVVGVWRREADRWWPASSVLNLGHGAIKRRALALTTLLDNGVIPAPLLVVVNYEAYWREPLKAALLRYAPDMVVYDELHRLKGRSTRQSRFAHYLADKVRWRVGLTGTPMASGPEDLFSLYKALDPRIFGTRWLDYERAYIVKGGYGGYSIVGYRNRAVLEERLAESSYRITKAEALDLPPQVDVMVPVPLTSRRVYDELRRRAIAEINGLSGESGTALSRCVLTNLLRLQQVTSGFVKVTDGREVELSTEKHDALADLLADAVPAVGRVVVFARFRHDIRVAARAAWGVVGDRAVYTMTGDTPQRQREGIIEDFLSSDRAVLVLQIAVGSLGIDLSRACVAIFYSPDYSLVNFLQARDRLHRLGQEQKVTYYHLVAEGTVDEAIYNSLAAKQDLTRSILDRASAAKIFA